MPRSFYSVMGIDKQEEMRQEFSESFPCTSDKKLHEALQEGDPLVEYEDEGGDYHIWENNMESLKQRLK